jgi:hypothetical protein
VLSEHALEHGAQIGGRLEVALLVEVGDLEARPIGDDAPAGKRAADKEGDRSRAVVSANGAVDAGGAAELSDRDDDRVVPARPEFAFERGEGAVETAEQLRQTAGRAALVGVRIPTVEGERADARAVVRPPSAAPRPRPPCASAGRRRRRA